MSTLYGPSQVRITIHGSNVFLAHLQVATSRRFGEGRGYLLTMAGSADDGRSVSTAYWMHPSIPLMFSYATEDMTGERPEPVDIVEDTVQVMLEFMDHPLGVRWGFETEQGITVPFFTDVNLRGRSSQ